MTRPACAPPRTALAVAATIGALAVAAPAPAAPSLAGCPVFPADNVWNRRVDTLPVAADSAAMVRAIGIGATLHPDFSDTGGYGIPFTIVGRRTPRSRVTFDYASESDRVPYPIPARPRIENGGDRHVLLLDRDACRLYELYAVQRRGTRWHAGSGAVWDLRSNRLRPDGWTSADAGGLPMLPGLARYVEVRAGVIAHALRFTAVRTRAAHRYPARHDAGADDPSLPPMGLRLRLKRSVAIDTFPPQARVVLTALRDYGMILADNGSPWYVGGAPDPGWDDDDLHSLGRLTGADLEVVDTRRLRSG